jgi:hypothetical protein
MDTITCPKCGTENPANAMNCKKCKVNLKFALANPDVAKGITQSIEHDIQYDQSPSTNEKATDWGWLVISLAGLGVSAWLLASEPEHSSGMTIALRILPMLKVPIVVVYGAFALLCLGSAILYLIIITDRLK